MSQKTSKTMKVELLFDAQAELAEGPVWCELRQRLVWVDVLKKRIHFLDPLTAKDRFIQLDVMVGAAYPYRDHKTLVIATERGIGLLDEETAEVEWLFDPEQNKPDNRFNDGKIGPDGHFWAGTMRKDGEGRGEGALYRFDLQERTYQKMIGDVGLSNGLDWHDQRFYFVDTHEKRIDVFEYKVETGTISNRKPFAEIREGFPDGLCVHRDGSVWIAQWGAGMISQFSQDGKFIQSVKVPAPHVSSLVCWNNKLAITTACDLVGNKQKVPAVRSGCIYLLSLQS